MFVLIALVCLADAAPSAKRDRQYYDPYYADYADYSGYYYNDEPYYFNPRGPYQNPTRQFFGGYQGLSLPNPFSNLNALIRNRFRTTVSFSFLSSVPFYSFDLSIPGTKTTTTKIILKK